MDGELIETIAEATAECGLQQLANWLPAGRHGELRELLHDLAYSAVVAYADARRGWFEVPVPGEN
jgi:hypothetical protein